MLSVKADERDMEKRGRRIKRKRMIPFFRVMRFFIGIYLITGPFRESPAASNGGPQPRAQRSGSRLEAKKFPVRLRSLAARRGIRAKQGQQSVGNKGKWEGARLAALRAAPNREPSGAGRGWRGGAAE